MYYLMKNMNSGQMCNFVLHANRYPLYKVGTEDHFLYIGDATGPVTHELQLPADLVCTQCVVQVLK